MESVNSQITEIEKEIRETPYHKGTEHHIGKLRARLAKLRDKALEGTSRGGGGGGGYAVKKQGDATVVLIGPPSAGKSLLLIMTDIERSDILNTLTNELESAGIRLNKEPPKVKIKKDVEGGLTIHSNIRQDMGEQTIKAVAQEFGVKNGEITINEKLDMNTLIDAFSPSRVYVPALFVVNKIDLTQKPSKSSNEFSLIEISAQEGKGIEGLLERIWERLNLLSVYLVRPKEEPSFKISGSGSLPFDFC
ncbi:MAG: hypothetical protein UT23_C0016G0020 [Candidatus Woesebacteria bacterium GW2011_GWA1_39_12]|uniref:GTP binding protein second domain-containing protein n=1 Tax=Candidatus Woesebacteria bacterium GW2011_GWA1_39_12 TaxID=1618549 RepID=A0A0G0LZ57_9BACT|nr:MAG: hypothetical protein UT23_C0016G0020 [Candidatus Woesebacteria bacterium GW2011_GWA1_39_12]